MICFIDKDNAPLKDVTPSMLDRRTNELAQQLESEGIQLTGGGDGFVTLGLRQLALKNGSIERGQVTLIAALEGLCVVRVDIEPADVGYIIGNSVDSVAISHALASGVEPVCRALQNVEISEIFDGFDRARNFIYSDRVDTSTADGSWVAEQLQRGAESELQRAGLLPGATNYADFLEPRYEAEPHELPPSFQTAPEGWRSPFDVDGDY